MIVTEEFINKQGSNSVRTFFRLATSLGYTILCSEDETGSLSRGFMLQNQYGALYSCLARENTPETMIPILRFINDFDRVGSSTTSQPSRIDQLEERISKIEKLLTNTPAAEAQESSTSVTILDELRGRARNIDNWIIDRIDGGLMYSRPTMSDCGPKGLRAIFTDDNILETQQARWHVNHRWTFSLDELDELEAVLAHDERLYAEHSTD